MLMSQVDSFRSEDIKKRFYISGQDEYNCSSEALNGLVLSRVIDAMPSYHSAHKGLKKGYIADLVREGGISPCSLLLGLMYIRRIASTNKEYISTISPRELFLVAMVVASKYMNDEGEMEALTNSEWAAIGSTPKRTLDTLERDFLQAIRWELYVPLKEFYDFVASAEGSVAMNQACLRGWCSYTDLTAMWTSSQFQEYMLKHTAKVALSGASLYLMCVSTLLAASHSLSISTLSPEMTSALQPDATPPGCLPVNQSFPLVDLVSNSSAPSVRWEEVWPGRNGRVVSETPPPFLSPDDSLSKLLLSPSSLTKGVWLHLLLGSCDHHHPQQPAAHDLHTRTHYQDTGLQDARLQDAGLQDTGLQDARLQDTGLQDARLQDTKLKSNGSGHRFAAQRRNIVLCPPTTYPATSTRHITHPTTSTRHITPLTTYTHTSHITHTPHLNHTTSPLLRSDNIITKATVETLQAEDLMFHHRGTLHWNPLINSSLTTNAVPEAGGPWRTIVNYLIPSQWTI